jgi:hypothetical protein
MLKNQWHKGNGERKKCIGDYFNEQYKVFENQRYGGIRWGYVNVMSSVTINCA